MNFKTTYDKAREAAIKEFAEYCDISIEEAEERLITDDPVDYVRDLVEQGVLFGDIEDQGDGLNIKDYVNYESLANDLRHDYYDWAEPEWCNCRFWFDWRQ